MFQQGFYSHYPHIKPQFMLMDYLVLLSYLSPQLFFKIKPFAGLSCLTELQCIIIVSFCLSTDHIIQNMATYKYTLYKTAKSQIVDHFYQHRPAKTAQCLSICFCEKCNNIWLHLTCNPPVEIEDHYLRSSHSNIINISHRWGYL